MTHSPMRVEAFEYVVATPISVEVLKSSDGKAFVELYLPDDPIRYRVAVERLRDFDDPGAFVRAATRKGAVFGFHVKRGARQNPEVPPLDPKPTVFAESMMVGDHEFYPIKKRIASDEREQLYTRIGAVFCPLLALYLGHSLWVERRRSKTAASDPGAGVPKRRKRKGKKAATSGARPEA